MKRKLKVSCGFSGVIAGGPFENSRPAFAVDEEFEIEGEKDEVDFAIETRLEELHQIAYGKFKAVELSMIAERIQKERKDFHFYEKDGKQYPSVTSILNFDADFFVSAEELAQYASQGTITHARCSHFVKTGNWLSAQDLIKEMPEIWTDYVIVTKGSLALSPDSGDFPAFLEKFPIRDMRVGGHVFNDEYLYGGLPDLIGIPEGGSWKELGLKPVETVFDWKRTVDEIKNKAQVAAYAKCLGISQGALIPLNDKTKQGFSKPTATETEKSFKAFFLPKRTAFRKRYGL